MDIDAAIAALGALAHELRLVLFKLLVQAGHEGMAAGMIAEKLAFPTARCHSTSPNWVTRA